MSNARIRLLSHSALIAAKPLTMWKLKLPSHFDEPIERISAARP
jgi:hypothetical protein